jgi:hypothetical protein
MNTTVLPRAGGGSAKGLARGLGWLSLALAAAELVAPRALSRAISGDMQPALLRTYGVRELVAGLGILTSSNPRPWLWSRLAGDALDLAALAPAMRRRSGNRAAAAVAFGMVAAVTALDLVCAARLERERAQIPAAWRRPAQPPRDYSDRSGFPRAPAAMRGRARDLLGAGPASDTSASGMR